MRVFGFRKQIDGEKTMLSASFAWEDADRPPRELTFEIEGVPGETLDPVPEPFAILGALAALHRGERRLRIEGTLCPRLGEGLRTAIRILRSWYSDLLPEPAIEPSGGFRTRVPPPARAALFLSGGGDSLSILKNNRDMFPPEHPASFRDAIFVWGFAARDPDDRSPRVTDLRARQMRSVRGIAEAAGLHLLTVRTAPGFLGEDDDFFRRCSHSSHLASVAHLFPARISSAAIAAGYDASYSVPFGSHPLLDVCYSSSAVEVRHEGFGRPRKDRIASVARWKEMLPHMIVCVQGPLDGGAANCGRCEKCVRTMLALLVAGALEDAPFPARDVDPSRLVGIRLEPERARFWQELVPAVRGIGRDDLASPIEGLLADLKRRSEWFDDRGWRGRLRSVDRRLFGGHLLAVRRRFGPAKRAKS